MCHLQANEESASLRQSTAELQKMLTVVQTELKSEKTRATALEKRVEQVCGGMTFDEV